MKINYHKSPSFAFLFLIAGIFFFYSCNSTGREKTFTIKNKLAINRSAETISIAVSQISALVEEHGAANLQIRESGSEEPLLTQTIDTNSDGKTDQIIFQTDMKPDEEKQFVVEARKNNATAPPEGEGQAFSRYVPENNEDFAWENDRVAFRAYGRVTEARESGGKVSGGTSGIDAWFKRVPYPIIDKWYNINQEAKLKKEAGAPHTDTYHTDTGEGYDPYVVGGSRGIGGTGIWENDTLYVSRPFIGYKQIATGPIRTIFELTYAPWQAAGRTIHEKKRISLDLGSNLSRYEISIYTSEPLPNIAAGIALHDGEGTVKAMPEEGWFRYWEAVDDSEVGIGIVLKPVSIQTYIDSLNAAAQDNLLVLMEAPENKVIYYAGYSWKKSGQYTSPQEWDQYLQHFSLCLASPLEVTFR
ncbi:hypothetical protein D770_23910 [Flammeovirgaceae bacterium 311]|nr:hypothetical protein D770_23910 [Flammeovirgaceae bacterium 311]